MSCAQIHSSSEVGAVHSHLLHIAPHHFLSHPHDSCSRRTHDLLSHPPQPPVTLTLPLHTTPGSRPRRTFLGVQVRARRRCGPTRAPTWMVVISQSAALSNRTLDPAIHRYEQRSYLCRPTIALDPFAPTCRFFNKTSTSQQQQRRQPRPPTSALKRRESDRLQWVAQNTTQTPRPSRPHHWQSAREVGRDAIPAVDERYVVGWATPISKKKRKIP